MGSGTLKRNLNLANFTVPNPPASHYGLRKKLRQLGDVHRASSAVRSCPEMILWLTLLGLCDQLDEAFHRLNLLGFAIVELWIMALVDGRAKLLRPPAGSLK
jgi:hypothetical protein